MPARGQKIRTRPKPPDKDPRERRVQINVPVPHWYREQVYDYCDQTGKSFASVVLGPLIARIPPRCPPKLAPWPPETYRWVRKRTTDDIDEAAE